MTQPNTLKLSDILVDRIFFFFWLLDLSKTFSP